MQTKIYFFVVGRSCGKAVMFVENISSEEETKGNESEDDIMDIDDEPAQKKTKIMLDDSIIMLS